MDGLDEIEPGAMGGGEVVFEGTVAGPGVKESGEDLDEGAFGTVGGGAGEELHGIVDRRQQE